MVNKDCSENYAEKMQRNLEYIECLEEERRKIQVFQRELPLSLDIVSQAIEACRKEMSLQGNSGSFEHTSKGGPVFEEFIPVKNVTSVSLDEGEQRGDKNKGKNVVSSSDDCSNDESKKSDWLKFVKLWNHTPDLSTDKDFVRELSVPAVQKTGSLEGFQLQPGSSARRQEVTNPGVSSMRESGGRGGGSSKARRYWSPELHRLFLAAIEELGGAFVATPKQIKEKMKVDGLTNDEVKSHLQKYRFQHERPSSSSSTQEPQIQSIILPSPQPPPQFIVLGGLWVPPLDYACTVADTTMLHSPPDRIYAPKPLRAQPPDNEVTHFLQKRKRSAEFQSNDQAPGHHNQSHNSDSSATSSSSQITPASRIVQDK